MNNKKIVAILAYFSLLQFSLLADAASDEWITLIDGTEGMENFTIMGDANWTAKDNAIQATEGNGASWLLSKESYSDFILRVEFWASDDANSGIYMRCQDRSRVTDRNCYEANVFDQRPDASYGTGGIVHVAPVQEPYPKAGDRWNVFVLTVRGDHLVVELNGKTTADVRDTQFSEGPFGLQWGRGTLRFRKVAIQPL